MWYDPALSVVYITAYVHTKNIVAASTKSDRTKNLVYISCMVIFLATISFVPAIIKKNVIRYALQARSPCMGPKEWRTENGCNKT